MTALSCMHKSIFYIAFLSHWMWKKRYHIYLLNPYSPNDAYYTTSVHGVKFNTRAFEKEMSTSERQLGGGIWSWCFLELMFVGSMENTELALWNRGKPGLMKYYQIRWLTTTCRVFQLEKFNLKLFRLYKPLPVLRFDNRHSLIKIFIIRSVFFSVLIFWWRWTGATENS